MKKKEVEMAKEKLRIRGVRLNDLKVDKALKKAKKEGFAKSLAELIRKWIDGYVK